MLRNFTTQTSTTGAKPGLAASNTASSRAFQSCLREARAKKRLLLLCSIVVLALAANQHAFRQRTASTPLVKMPIVDIERPCPAPDYPVLGEEQSAGKICITTLTDEKKADLKQRLVRWRSFKNLLQMTWQNKQDYADKHGYYLFDGSDLLDTSRPPSWSKNVAVRRLLTEEACDWVFWLDADTVIMNSKKKIESFLPADKNGQDFLVTLRTKDNKFGYNAGAWLIRNTEWSLQFLDHWWGMTDYVKPKGEALSGDNQALNAYLKAMSKQDKESFQHHVGITPKCHFNSASKFLTPPEAAELERNVTFMKEQPWYMNINHYHKGDLVAHVAGYDNKIDTIAMLLEHAT